MDSFRFFNFNIINSNSIIPKISIKKDILEWTALSILGATGLY